MSSDPRPNILLITTDQQRYDTVGVHGYNWMKTPHLDALARRGTLFHRAFVQNPVCIPSRACMQTGRYTHEHGVRYMESVIDGTPGLPAWETTFMERLQAAGYRTGAFGKIHMMPEKGFHELQVCGGKGARWTRPAGQKVGLAPLGRDYAAWLEERHPGGYEEIYEQRRQSEYRDYRTAITNVLPVEEYVDTWIAENTIEFAQRDHDRPFFAWCGFCGPHPPLDPPKPYNTVYPIDDVQLPPNYAVDENGNERQTSAEEDLVARRFCAYYWGLVTFIDDMVGRIVDALEAKGLLESTLIIFTSDHGEMMLDFGRTGKGNFYEAVIRVPLIVLPPGASSGREVSGLVEVFDLAPTILDYAGCEVPANMSATTLRPILEGRETGREAVFCEHLTNDQASQGVSVRTERYKYIHWKPSGPEQFFDLQEDPLERRNLIGEEGYRDEISRHRLLLIERLM